ncbi:hypothetical protein J2S62_002067 [Enteractinococcus fodinae]|uniref:Uncharacterized protein n=1 Tax=Enteractinococcus fodinae TaxID=684663 RepID=A0ABU2B2G9_9MICC|nr:hypothetical protein [Enteractinococcus fodinae]
MAVDGQPASEALAAQRVSVHRRHECYAIAERSLNYLPFIKDVAGLAIDAHAGGVSAGLVDFNHPGGEDVIIGPHYYPEVVQPALEHRLPAAGRLVEQRTWGCMIRTASTVTPSLAAHPGSSKTFISPPVSWVTDSCTRSVSGVAWPNIFSPASIGRST